MRRVWTGSAWSRTVMGGVLAAASTAGLAQAVPLPVHLPAQPLGTALEQLAAQLHIDILFTPDVVAGRRAPALDGR